MDNESFEVSGSATFSYIIVDQIKEHYLAAKELLAGPLNREGLRFWIYGQVIDACCKSIENLADRIAREETISRKPGEKTRVFHLRVCEEAGIAVGQPGRDQMKEMFDQWNRRKHSGDGEAWKVSMARQTRQFTLATFHLTSALLAAYFRLRSRPHDLEALRCAVVRGGEITLEPITEAAINSLLEQWGVSLVP